MMKLNDTQIALLAARTLISDPENWTQGAYARTDQDSGFLLPSDSRAARWCPDGAIQFSSPNHRIESSALTALSRAMNGNIVRFSDAPGRTHAEIMNAFDRSLVMAGKVK